MDWVTLTREEVEADALPAVCMECGGHAPHRVNRTFVKDPEWVESATLVGFLAGILPGLIIDGLSQRYLRRRIRVSCPFCRGTPRPLVEAVAGRRTGGRGRSAGRGRSSGC